MDDHLRMTRPLTVRARRFAAVTVAVAVATGVACSQQASPPGGTIGLQWAKVSDKNVVGYRIYYGRAAGAYDRHVDVGLETSHELKGLEPCTEWFVAIKARDAAGRESGGFSEEIRGWPRPTVASVTPARATHGDVVTLTIVGENFQKGATVQVSGEGVTIGPAKVTSCRELVAEATIAAAAATGDRDVEVVNEDGTFGVGSGLLTIAPR